jgi:putative tryptophan/tyrosine transport system substrate-binding protein
MAAPFGRLRECGDGIHRADSALGHRQPGGPPLVLGKSGAGPPEEDAEAHDLAVGVLTQRIVVCQPPGVAERLLERSLRLLPLDELGERGDVEVGQPLLLGQHPVVVEARQELPAVELDRPAQRLQTAPPPLGTVSGLPGSLEAAFELFHVEPVGGGVVEPEGLVRDVEIGDLAAELTQRILKLPEGVRQASPRPGFRLVRPKRGRKPLARVLTPPLTDEEREQRPSRTGHWGQRLVPPPDRKPAEEVDLQRLHESARVLSVQPCVLHSPALTLPREGSRGGAVALVTHRRALALAALVALVVVGGCGGAEARGETKTIAFLRAVPGAPSTEPTFLAELRSLGWVQGRTLEVLALDPDEAYPDPEEAQAAVARWQEAGVDLVVALSTSGAAAARDAAPDLPVLFLSNDPVAAGLVADERSPEGSLTGVTFRVPTDRTLDLVLRVLPDVERIGLPYPPADPAATANRDAFQAAADRLGLGLVTAHFTDETDVADAVAKLAPRDVDALFMSTSPVATRALQATEMAAPTNRLPVAVNTSLSETALVSLFPDSEELGRQLGRQAARILSGSSPGSVPVEDPRHFVLVVNLVAAESLGLEIPTDVLREADGTRP